MKKLLFFGLMVSVLFGCNNKTDNRDKYVGEYKLYIDEERYGERKGGNDWSYYTRTYDMEYWHKSFGIDSSKTLIVRKVDYDTISVVFDIVRPFSFKYQQSIIEKNKEIKKRNAESISGPDEPLLEVPEPSYPNNRELCCSYDGYVQGHKIFLNGYEDRKDYYKGAWCIEEVTYDSVYLRNDTLRFIRRTKSDVFYDYEFNYYRVDLERYCAIKIK